MFTSTIDPESWDNALDDKKTQTAFLALGPLAAIGGFENATEIGCVNARRRILDAQPDARGITGEAGIIGAVVIASWSTDLIRDTGAILLDMNPEPKLPARMRQTLETDGDKVANLHVRRIGPGRLGAIVSMLTTRPREAGYRSHQTVEMERR